MLGNILSAGDIILLTVFLIGITLTALYFLNKWAAKRMTEQQDVIEKTKMSTTIYVIDKKKDKVANANLPKAVLDQMPKTYKFLKVPLVKIKVGPQVMTVLCDKKVYEILPVKKTVTVELAGIYILSMKGMKSDKEMKEIKKAKKLQLKEDKKKKSE